MCDVESTIDRHSDSETREHTATYESAAQKHTHTHTHRNYNVSRKT